MSHCYCTKNALYSVAFGTHTKTAKPIEMSFWMNGLGPRNSVLRWVTIPEGERTNLWKNMCPTSLTPLWIANWTGSCSGTWQEQTLDCKRWSSLLSAAKGVGLHTAGEGWYIRLPCYWWFMPAILKYTREKENLVVFIRVRRVVFESFRCTVQTLRWAFVTHGVGRAFSRVCLFVCLFVRALQGNRLELSTPNLVHVYSIAVAR